MSSSDTSQDTPEVDSETEAKTEISYCDCSSCEEVVYENSRHKEGSRRYGRESYKNSRGHNWIKHHHSPRKEKSKEMKYHGSTIHHEKRKEYVPLNIRSHLLADYFSNDNKELFLNEISSNTILTYSDINYPFSGVYLGRINIKKFYELFYSYIISIKSYQGETYCSFGGSKFVVTKDINQRVAKKDVMTKYWFVFTYEMVFNNSPSERPNVELMRIDIHSETPLLDLYKDIAKPLTSEDVTLYEDMYKKVPLVSLHGDSEKLSSPSLDEGKNDSKNADF